MKKLKGKIIISSLIFVIGMWVNFFFTAAIHEILTNQSNTVDIINITEILKSLATDKQHLLLFLCFQGFIGILSVLFILQNLRPYQSELKEITPEIKTPIAVGQYQHGSARWLNDEEKDTAFKCYTLNPSDKLIKAYIGTGYDDLKFIKPEVK